MFVSHLESALDGTRFEPGRVSTVHQGRPLWVRYDLARVRNAVRPEAFAARPPSLWRYRELLPLPAGEEPVTLGEGMTPLLPCPRLGRELGLSRLFVKDESQLPTGSFKSRGMTAAVSLARQLGLKRLAIPTAGNAGGALAAYGARAGMEVYVFMPDDTPVINQLEAHLAGARVFLVNGLITDCGRLVREGTVRTGWFDCSTLREPYLLEGKKTMGLEIAEQLGWRLPDAILYPTGGGTGLIGMWKAFDEMETLGWIGNKRPRMFAVQAAGCAPIVRAFEAGEKNAAEFPDARTIASGLRVPKAIGDFLILKILRQSNGGAIAVDDEEMIRVARQVGSSEGLFVAPEAAACFAAFEKLRRAGRLRPSDRVVIFNTGSGVKYLDCYESLRRS